MKSVTKKVLEILEVGDYCDLSYEIHDFIITVKSKMTQGISTTENLLDLYEVLTSSDDIGDYDGSLKKIEEYLKEILRPKVEETRFKKYKHIIATA